MEKILNDTNQQDIAARVSQNLAGVAANSIMGSRVLSDDTSKEDIRSGKAVKRSPRKHHALNSEARYRDLFEADRDGMVTVDPKTGTILEVNPYLTKLMDYPKAHFIGKALWELGLFADIQASRKAFRRIKAKKCTWFEDLPLKHKDGRLISVQFVCTVYGVRENRVIQCHIRDTSGHKNTQERGPRLQTQKMEAVGQLAAGMAHDFNNLLQVILGYSEILQARVDLPEPVRKMIGTIQEAGISAKSLTHRILAFSRQQEPHQGRLDLNEAVSRAHMLLSGLIGDDIELVSFLDPDLGIIESDPHQMDQILINLAINARDAMPKGGKITFETTNVVLGDNSISLQNSMEPGRYVMLSVRDTGTGMNEKVQRQIFQPFFTTKAMNHGTGLGLSTVHSIVKQNGGTISVWSQPNHGTRFTMYFPRRDAAPLACRHLNTETSRRGSETILLVDDAPSLRLLLRIFLEHHGYTVLDAGHPAEALRISHEFKGLLPLMITDVSMPGLSGPDLAERLAADRPETKVIYISGDPHGAAARHGIEGSRYALIEKPFTCEDLMRRVRQVLDLPTSRSA